MGIKDLSKFIRSTTDAYHEVHLSKFYGKKVAVDISVFLYKTIRSVGEENWMTPMILLLKCLKKYGIKIVCVFDGPNAPVEKMKEREERKKSSNKIQEKVKEVRDVINEVKEFISDDGVCGNLPVELRVRIKTICMKQRDKEKYDAIDYRDIHQSLKILLNVERKFMKQALAITKNHSEIVKEIVHHLGMAVMQADGEAETMCAYMCVKGMVDAVLSEDSDVLPYTTPIFLSKLNTKTDTVMMIKYSELIEKLKFDSKQFRDFCIMCSCDYNDRIKLPLKEGNKKQTGIGPIKAYALLQEHGDLDSIEYMTDYDLTPLNYKRCRVLFTIPTMYDGLILPYNKPIDLIEVEKFLIKYKCKFLLKQLQEAWAPTPIVFESTKIASPIKESSNKESPTKESPTKKSSNKESSNNISINVVSPNNITIYTDGSCKPNPGVGGWACLIESEGFKKILRGSKDYTTNNQMELQAIYEALNYLDENDLVKSDTKVDLYTDSEYCKNCVTVWIEGWKKNNWMSKDKQPVKNKTIIQDIHTLNKKLKVEWHWVKAHEDNEKNNIVDEIAQEEANKLKNNK